MLKTRKKKFIISSWKRVANRLPGRIGRQCRERWRNHVNPNLLKFDWTEQEDELLHKAVLRKEVGDACQGIFSR